MNVKKNFNRNNKIKFTKTYFYKFIKLKRSNRSTIILNNLHSALLLNLFFLEKNKFKNLKKNLKDSFFKTKLWIFHKKTTFIRNMDFYYYYNNNYMPIINNWRFIRRTFWYIPKHLTKLKLKKINSFLYRTQVYNKQPKINKREFYYLAKDAIFSKVSILRRSLYFLKKKFFSLRSRIYYSNIAIKKFFFKKNKKLSFNWLSWLSRSLSNNFKKILLSNNLLKRIRKFKKKIYTLEFKIPSFYDIHNYEFYTPYQVLYFRKSIINFTNIKYVVLPTKNLMINNLEIIKKFLLKKFLKMGLKNINFINLTFNDKYNYGYGFKFFNLKRLEKVIIPVILFFKQYKRSYLLELIYFYIDTFLLKKKFLPSNLRKLLKWLIKQGHDVKDDILDENYDIIFDGETISNTYNKKQEYLNDLSDEEIEKLKKNEYDDKLMTLVFYKFLSEIFNLIFTFSPGEITFLDSKPWKHIFDYQLEQLTLHGKNWEFLNYYSWEFIGKKKYRYKPIIYKTNKFLFKQEFFYFNFFLKQKKATLEANNLINLQAKKPQYQNLYNYLAKNYFPSDFIWSQIFWRMFYMRVLVKTRWFKNRAEFGKVKVTYDSFLNLQNKFWPEFFFSKTHSERVLIYGFTFWNGQCDFNLDWNFLVSYKGDLNFWLKRKKPVYINNKKLFWEKIVLGYFSTMRHNQFFSSFFSFLNWSYLLEYYLQFGHTKSNYNTSYKDYLIMVYNERFIINLLT